MIDPGRVRLFVPNGLKGFKQDLFNRIAAKVGGAIRGNIKELENLPDAYIPVVGCTPELMPLIRRWQKAGRTWVYWDRGYWLRCFATSLPRGENGGLYRWHLNSFQLSSIRNVPKDRFDRSPPPVEPWKKGGRHIVVAAPSATYCRFHGCENWLNETIDKLSRVTDRQLVVRAKEHCVNRPLQRDLEGAHALVTHGSIAAVESVILGTPVFVHPDSAASLVGLTDLTKIEKPVYPERQPWLNALAYSQFSENELVDGTLWRLIA